MSALTRDRATSYREGIEVEFPVAATTKIYAGSMVCVNAGGYAAPAADTSGYRFVGVALEQVDNSSGANGAMWCGCGESGSLSSMPSPSPRPRWESAMYAVDDQTFADAAGATNDIRVGILVKYVSATKGWIDIAR